MKMNPGRSQTIKLIVISGVFILFCHALCCASPLSNGNRFPALFMFLTPVADAPEIPEQGHLILTASIDYTSVFVDEETDDWEVFLDFEMTTVSILLEFAPLEGVSISAAASFVDMGNGFLDGFLDEYHSAGGFPDYGRSERPHNEFSFYMREADGTYWVQAENEGFKLADSVVSVKAKLLTNSDLFMASGHTFDAAVKYSLKVPVGEFDQGLSSKEFDHGLFLLTAFSKDRLTYYLNPGVILLERPETLGADVSVKNLGTLFTGVSYTKNDQWRLLAQLNCFTSPFDTGIKFFDNPGVELTLGFQYQFTKLTRFEFAFSEDLAGSVPDFTVRSGVVYRF